MARARHQKGASALMKLAFGVALIGPLLVGLGAFGVRFGLIDWTVGYQVLTLKAGWIAALIGVAVSLGALIYGVVTRRSGGVWLVGLGLAFAGATAAGVWRHAQQLAAHPPVHEASSDWEDRPGFSHLIDQRRARAGAPALATTGDAAACPGAVAVPIQAAPEQARAALEASGVQVIGVAPFRAEGEKRGFWFGFTQDVTIRIRPGQTDVRVAGREDRPDGGDACRLATRIVEALKAEVAAG